MSPSLSTEVGIAERGRYLIDLLSDRFTYLSRGDWEAEIVRGTIVVNGSPTLSRYELRQGDTITYYSNSEEPPVPENYRIIHRERDFIAIDKPPGLPCHPGGRYRTHTLWNLLSRDFPDPPHFVNRLDRETSGIIIAAFTKNGRQLFITQKVTKGYLVMVHGSFPKELDANGWIFQDKRSAIRKKQRFSYSHPDRQTAKTAHTTFSRLRLAESGDFSLLRADITTGRTHQIRAILSNLGYPIVGDKLYGQDETLFLRFAAGDLSPDDQRRLLISHQAVHSSHFSFQPQAQSQASDIKQRLDAGLPQEFAGLAAQHFGIDLSSASKTAEIFQ